MARKKPLTPFEQVEELHKALKHPVEKEPVIPDVKTIKLRINLIAEELGELIDACGGEGYSPHLDRARDMTVRLQQQVRQAKDYEFEMADILGVADALGDIEVVNNGAAHCWGIPLPAVVTEIHRSNMTKLDENGEPIYDENGKAQKGPNYEPPNLPRVLWPERFEQTEEAD